MALLHLRLPPLRPAATATATAAPRRHYRPPTPARDRIIDFGKHKGRMLGSLPSKYLLWVSRTLRAGDSEPWARLADEVLADPVYRDRLEWEAAERVLTGDDGRMSSKSGSAVAELLEISERFRWDNEDKAGWERVNFGLLGTSQGGRIPRIGEGWGEERGRKVVGEGGEGKRVERRERRRERRVEGNAVVVLTPTPTMMVTARRRELRGEGNAAMTPTPTTMVTARRETVNPFPGRGAILDKIKGRREGKEIDS